MKKFFVFFLFIFPSLSFSADVSFDLHSIRFGDLARVVLDDVNAGSLILSPDVLEDRRELSFTVKKTTAAQAVEQLQKVASGMGYSVVQSSGIWYVGKSVDDSEIVVYFPKAKAASYLVDVLNGVIPGVKSATSRLVNDSNAPQSRTEDKPGTVSSLIGKAQQDLMVVTVPKNRVSMVHSILSQIDIPTAEIEVKAMLLEVQTGKSEANAINFLMGLLGGKLGIEWSGGADQKRGVSIKLGAIDALWSAIESDRRFKVISSPRLRVKSGASARFSVGSEVPVLGAVTYQQGGQAVQSVDYKPAGVILDLFPEIRQDHAEITIKQQMSNFIKTETGVNNSPTLLKRELSTVVTAKKGELVVLGGLNESKESGDRSGFFFFPKFLHSRSEDSSSTEILMLLHVEKLGIGI